jgi:hypothetical protein
MQVDLDREREKTRSDYLFGLNFKKYPLPRNLVRRNRFVPT